VPARVRVEWWSISREAEAGHGEWVVVVDEMATDDRRANPHGAATEACAIQSPVNCEVDAGLRRWNSRVPSSPVEAREAGGRRLRHATDSSRKSKTLKPPDRG
jgi:hypothetical protein